MDGGPGAAAPVGPDPRPAAAPPRGAPCAGCLMRAACDCAGLPPLVGSGGDPPVEARLPTGLPPLVGSGGDPPGAARLPAVSRERRLRAETLRFTWGDKITRLQYEPPEWLVRGQYESALQHLVGTPAATRAAAYSIHPLAVWLTQQYGLTPHRLRFTRRGACEMTLRRDPFSDSPQAPDNFRVSAGPARPPPPPLPTAITWELFVHRLPGGLWAINGSGAPADATTGQVFLSLRPIGVCLALEHGLVPIGYGHFLPDRV